MSPQQRITKDDIEAKLREVAAPVEEGVGQAKSIAPIAAVAVAAALVLTAYLLGRRRGKRRTPVIEIRRI
jgi:hypothetical protein